MECFFRLAGLVVYRQECFRCSNKAEKSPNVFLCRIISNAILLLLSVSVDFIDWDWVIRQQGYEISQREPDWDCGYWNDFLSMKTMSAVNTAIAANYSLFTVHNCKEYWTVICKLWVVGAAPDLKYRDSGHCSPFTVHRSLKRIGVSYFGHLIFQTIAVFLFRFFPIYSFWIKIIGVYLFSIV